MASEASAKVLVSVISHRHGDAVLELLRDLARHAHRSVARIVLTLNVAEPEVEAAAAAACAGIALQIRRNPRPLGFGENHNAAFAESGDASWFAVLNPDLRLHDDPFPALLAALRATPDAACAYPQQIDALGQPCNPPRAVPTPGELLARYLTRAERPDADDWVNAAFLLFDARVYAKLGGFDPGYWLYCEDVDICLRLQLAGHRLVGADATVQHLGRRASHVQLLHLYWHAQSLLRLWRSPVRHAYQRLRDAV
jgi:GT2 family glycosyltransferase